MEIDNNIFVLWHCWLQFFFQHDIHLQILQNARGRSVPGQNGGFCYDVHIWWCLYDSILLKQFFKSFWIFQEFYIFYLQFFKINKRFKHFLINISQIFAFFVNLLFLGHAFTLMLVYVWSRRTPFVRMNFFGLLNFNVSIID